MYTSTTVSTLEQTAAATSHNYNSNPPCNYNISNLNNSIHNNIVALGLIFFFYENYHIILTII